jgi:hypothetical protein
MRQRHPHVARLLSALLALGGIVALVGAYGLIAAVLGTLAWLVLPEDRPANKPRRTALYR